jgi:hypothetical protein
MSNPVPFRRIKQEDPVAQRVQQNVGASIDSLVAGPLTGAQIATFTATAKVAHGTTFTVGNPLQRVPRGIFPLIGVVDGLFGLVSATAQALVLICTSDIPANATTSFVVF